MTVRSLSNFFKLFLNVVENLTDFQAFSEI